jgi:hypothetical protein
LGCKLDLSTVIGAKGDFSALSNRGAAMTPFDIGLIAILLVWIATGATAWAAGEWR